MRLRIPILIVVVLCAVMAWIQSTGRTLEVYLPWRDDAIGVCVREPVRGGWDLAPCFGLVIPTGEEALTSVQGSDEAIYLRCSGYLERGVPRPRSFWERFWGPATVPSRGRF